MPTPRLARQWPWAPRFEAALRPVDNQAAIHPGTGAEAERIAEGMIGE